jgi:Uma2 family endonuclease
MQRQELVMSQAISTIGQPTIEIVSLFPKQGHWTEEDYFRLPETNKIIELSEGRLIISPSPTEQHQIIIGKLHLLIGNHVFKNNIGKVLMAPMDVRLKNGIIRQPDIVFMSNEHLARTTNKRWGIPDLAVEVTSPGTKREDRKVKYAEYENAGIKEYWIVDQDKQTVEVFEIKDRRYVMIGSFHGSDTVTSNVLKDFSFKAESIFA